MILDTVDGTNAGTKETSRPIIVEVLIIFHAQKNDNVYLNKGGMHSNPYKPSYQM